MVMLLPEDSVESTFVDVWKDRSRIQPKIARNWVDSEWAKGRKHFLTFLIRVRDEKIAKRIVEIQNKLSAIPCVDPFPMEYLHITVKGCGFLARFEKYEDDILTENLQKIVSEAKEVLQTFNRFDISFSKLNIFSEVVLIEVHDGGKIGELNKGLQAIPEIKRMKFDYPNFLPHISISQFQNRLQFNRLIGYLERLRDTEFGELTVDHIELVNANLSEKYPILKNVHAFRLRYQHY
jgi:2'-5' RNA ligase